MPRPLPRRSLLQLFALLASGCAAGAPRVATADEARRIAIDVAAKGGYAPPVYTVRAIERVKEGSFAGSWAVSFEHAPPAPPGGHCTVYVRADGTAQLFHGE